MVNDDWIDIFIYGSLKPDQKRSDILSISGVQGQSEYRMMMMTKRKYDLLDFGGFAGLIYGDYEIGGELYKVSPETLAILDRYEDCPNLFYRDHIELENGFIAQAYFFNFDERGQLLLNAFERDSMGKDSRITFLRDKLKIWTDF
jgi:gamma-glutamylcyclotransferase (GGCT)/AIG2-like uncharacterized protein YtfP